MSEPNDEAQMPNNKGKTKKEARESHEQTQKKSGRKTSFASFAGKSVFFASFVSIRS